MKDTLAQRTAKWIMRQPYTVALTLWRGWRRVSGQQVWELGGECRSCAQCCEAPAMGVGILVARVAPARAVFLWWQRAVNGFHLKEARAGGYVMAFDCSHFDRRTRLCDSYDSRPGMCRDYPRLLLHSLNPRFFDGCGHRAVLRGGDNLLKILDDQPMTSHQREKLKDRLRLR